MELDTNNIRWVGRVYRVHPWSHEEGGYDLVVKFTEGKCLGYDWIKKPQYYLSSVLRKMDIELTDAETVADRVESVWKRLPKYSSDNHSEFTLLWERESEVTLNQALIDLPEVESNDAEVYPPRFFTGSYQRSPKNFSIFNLSKREEHSKATSTFKVLKNVLQRGKKVKFSKFLSDNLNSLDLDTPVTFLSQNPPKWDGIIKGAPTGENPALEFFEKLPIYFSEFPWLNRLVKPECLISEICRTNEIENGLPIQRFYRQQVDFYWPDYALVVEIDGSHHMDPEIMANDVARDAFLEKHHVQTIRITTDEFKTGNAELATKLDGIKQRVSRKDEFNLLCKETYITEPPLEGDKKLWPASIFRWQTLILELLIKGRLSLEDASWDIQIKACSASKGCEKLAFTDLFEWLKNLLRLRSITLNKPALRLQHVNDFDEDPNLKIDFSIEDRYDQTQVLGGNSNIVYCRSAYLEKFFNLDTKSQESLSHFQVSTDEPIEYLIGEFDDNQVDASLRFLLMNIFGHDNFREGQLPIIKNALKRRQTLGLLPTGSGKSLTFQFVVLLQPALSFVVCPIKSLMQDQQLELKTLGIDRCSAINSDTTSEEREYLVREFGSASFLLTYISPERFQSQRFRDQLRAIGINFNYGYAVIDEVHCLSEWGHDFRLAYLTLASSIRDYAKGSVFMGLTATASQNVLNDIKKEFELGDTDICYPSRFSRPELTFKVIDCAVNHKTDKLKQSVEEFLERNSQRAAIVFFPWPNMAWNLKSSTLDSLSETRIFTGKKPDDLALNDSEWNEYKSKVVREFKENKFRLLCATKSFGMGVNKPNVGLTIHFVMPGSMEAFYQEAGRAGRDEKPSECIMLLTQDDETVLDDIFDPSLTFIELENRRRNLGHRYGNDIFTQLFLHQRGLGSEDEEWSRMESVYGCLKTDNTEHVIMAQGELNMSKADAETAIYRLACIGIVKDWTISNWNDGIFKVYTNNLDQISPVSAVKRFIREYENDFMIDAAQKRHSEFFEIASSETFLDVEKAARILLRWSYQKFTLGRLQSLKNLYDKCSEVARGQKDSSWLKRELEAFFSVSGKTFLLQEIAEHNNDRLEVWFENMFYDGESGAPTNEKDLVDLNGNLQRYLESYQTNTGLNLLQGLVPLLLGRELNLSQKLRMEGALQEVFSYDQAKQEYIFDQIKRFQTSYGDAQFRSILQIVYGIASSKDQKIKLAVMANDDLVLLTDTNERITRLLKTL